MLSTVSVFHFHSPSEYHQYSLSGIALSTIIPYHVHCLTFFYILFAIIYLIHVPTVLYLRGSCSPIVLSWASAIMYMYIP